MGYTFLPTNTDSAMSWESIQGSGKKNISNAIEVARSCSSLAELKELAQEWCELQGDFVSSLQQLFNWTGCPVGGRLGTTGHCPWDSVRAKIDGGLTMFNGLTNRHSDICIYVYMYILVYIILYYIV